MYGQSARIPFFKTGLPEFSPASNISHSLNISLGNIFYINLFAVDTSACFADIVELFVCGVGLRTKR